MQFMILFQKKQFRSLGDNCRHLTIVDPIRTFLFKMLVFSLLRQKRM